MNRQYPIPETSPRLPSVTKDRHPHTVCWRAVTAFHTPLGTALPQLLPLQYDTACIICHFCLRTPPAQHSSTAMDQCLPLLPQNVLPTSDQKQASAAKPLVKHIFKALDLWLSTATPCDGKQPSTTPTAQIRHPSPSESKPAKPLPCLSWTKVAAAAWVP